jgi:hypothetical protein
MIIQNKKIILKKINELKKNKKKIFFSGIIKYDYDIFQKKLKSTKFILNCIEKITNGKIYILTGALDEKFIEDTKKKLNVIRLKEKPIKSKILSGIKNGYYVSNNTETKGYKTVDTSFYFFSWNKDKTGIYNKIMKIYKPLKKLNGLNRNEITTNKPKDGIIERLHIINYPINSGQISRHYDPINVSIFNFGIYGTQYGKDYSKGGFFVLGKNKKKIILDKKIKKTEIVLFYPSLIHGVDKIKKSNIENKFSGRWFFNVNHIQSHEIKGRQYTKKI